MYKTGGLKYSTANIGDEIQSIAADRIVGKIDKRFCREKLAEANGETKFNIVFNGWYSHNSETSFPPKNIFNPVFYSFHIYRGRKNVKYFTKKKCISYFKKNEPIGCRDINTMKTLQKHNVDAFYSGCVTMTFPTRMNTPSSEKIFFVDADFAKEILPDALSKIPYETINQGIRASGDKFEYAEKLLNKYRDEATLIVTTRLHCALPCVAMGIPVVLFFDPSDERMKTVKSIGLKIYRDRMNYSKPINFLLQKLGVFSRIKKWHQNRYLKKLQVNNSVNWTPEVLDIEERKKEIIDNLNKAIQKKFK